MDPMFSPSNHASTEWSGSAEEGGTGETQRWENWASAASEGGEGGGGRDHEQQQEEACCPVCMERRPPEAMCRLRCFHQVCAQCLPQLQVGRCPICRERIHPIEPPAERPRYAAVAGMLPGRQAGSESVISRTALLGPLLLGENSEAGEAEAEERSSGEPMAEDSLEGEESLGAVDQLLRSSLQEFMDHMRHPTMTHTAATNRSHAPSAPTRVQRSSAPIHVVPPEVPLDEMYSPLLHDDEEILSSSHPLSPGTEATPLSSSQERIGDRRAVVVVCAEDSLHSTLEACRTLLG